MEYSECRLEYAVSTSPRKGVPDEELHKIDDVVCVRVLQKGVERWASSAKDAWGDRDGSWKQDGIRCQLVSHLSGQIASEQVYKARDFLMPWHTYKALRDADEAARQARIAEFERNQELFRQRFEGAKERLQEFAPDLIWTEDPLDTVGWHVRIRSNSEFSFSPGGVEHILGIISTRVYEILSEDHD